jgi:hypothetical protein
MQTRCRRAARDCDPNAEAAIPTADFARIVRASRGAHCRPLHPRLAFLCSAPEAAFVAPGSGETTEPKGSTAIARRQPPFDDVYLQEDFLRRDRGYLRPPICPATFLKLSSRPSRSAHRSTEGHGQR